MRLGFRLSLLLAVYVGAACAQSPIAPQATPVFEVAAIKPHVSAPHEHSHIYNSAGDGNFKTINVSLKALLQYAFAIPQSRIVDAPGWVGSEMFDIDAKSDAAVDEQLHKMSSDEAKPIKLRMVQALLAERFGLAVHRETRTLPLYELVVAKGGSKLEATNADGLMISHGNGYINAQGLTVAGLAQELAQDVGRVVVDKSGVEGRFDINLKWMVEDSRAAMSGESSGPSIFTAIQEQLGLKLEAQKGPVEVLAIDHIERPSAN